MRHTKHGGLGWVRDNPNFRDHQYAAPQSIMANLPLLVDKRADLPPAYDQSNLGSCVWNALGGAIEFDLKRQKMPVICPSRLFGYYETRLLEGSVHSDAGCVIRDAIKVIARKGAPHETLWPYDIAKFATKPPANAYKDALLRQAIRYARVTQSAMQLKGCLAAGFPVVFGFTVFESFESDEVAQTGMMPMPASNEAELGGHAVLIVGYRDSDRRFIVRNSWGTAWGDNGHFYMPYEYATNTGLAADFWKIELMEVSST